MLNIHVLYHDSTNYDSLHSALITIKARESNSFFQGGKLLVQVMINL